MTNLARFINPDNAGLNEVRHDSSLIGKGTSKSKLRVSNNGLISVLTDGETVNGNGTSSSPLTIIPIDFQILTEDSKPLLTEDGQIITTEEYYNVPYGLKNIISISPTEEEWTLRGPSNAVYVINSNEFDDTTTFFIPSDLDIGTHYTIVVMGTYTTLFYMEDSDRIFMNDSTDTPVEVNNESPGYLYAGDSMSIIKVTDTEWVATSRSRYGLLIL